MKRNTKPGTLKRALRSQNSLRLLVADEIQSGLEEVEKQEKTLEERGATVEQLMRSSPSECLVTLVLFMS